VSDAALGAFFRPGGPWDGGPLGDGAGSPAGMGDVLRGLAAAPAVGDDKEEAGGLVREGLAGGEPVMLALLGAYWGAQAGEPEVRKHRGRQQG
jgi:NAD(P)H-hydrate repair Nnr-like enzyme with NAD(P)H-hydrate dehydratase domain